MHRFPTEWVCESRMADEGVTSDESLSKAHLSEGVMWIKDCACEKLGQQAH